MNMYVKALAALGIVATTPAFATCKVSKIAELPVSLIGREALVDARFGTHETRFIIDSGAAHSNLSRAAAAEFGLKTEPAPAGFRLGGINGDSSAAFAKAKDFTLAGIPLPSVRFVVGGSDFGKAGLIGQDILGLADTEYDLPHGAVRLMKVEDCGDGELAYWAGRKPFSTLQLEKGRDGARPLHTIGTVSVNGVVMRAIFDSGAEKTTITAAAAKRAGVTPQNPGAVLIGTSFGIGSRRIPMWRATFDKIDIGGEIVSHPKIQIEDIGIDGDMLIGFDFFMTHRIFVSNAGHRLYTTYEGGPVFGVSPTGARTATGEKLDLADHASEPSDAEGYARRGTVFMSQRKFVEGFAEYDRAVALAPGEGRFVYLRAQARLARGQRPLAAADLDKAVALMPEDADVRLSRARFRLADHDGQGALEDLAVADHVLPPGSQQRLRLAGLYQRLSRPEAAITNYDAWLKMHGEDAQRDTAFDGRCVARASLGHELDRALSDCNAAVKLSPASARYLSDRALVRLRLGKIDAALADYDAAVKADPRDAWPLYGRALAKRRLGKADAAEADRKAALSINPAVAERATRDGLDEPVPVAAPSS